MKFVTIHSSLTITVTPGLQNLDVTNPDAHVPDRLKVSPQWPRATVQIVKGVGKYPAEIAEWNTVKSLAKKKILTIGEITEDADAETEKKAVDLERNLGEIEPKKKTKKEKTLADVAGE